MPNRRFATVLFTASIAALLLRTPANAQRSKKKAAAAPAATESTHITTPQEFFGFNIGDDYQEANYTKAVEYWKKLATESNRMKLVDMGPTEMGQRQIMVIISSPENMAHLDHYREINAKLARAEGLTDAEAHALAKEGKAVVWIDGGLHASETVGFQQLVETIYEMVSKTDPETMRFLNDDIGLYVPANPDGSEMVANWYMRIPTPDQRTMDPGLPTVYNKYVGHDDNRDSYMSNMDETENMNKVLYQEWFPEILYNHHQTGPAGGVIFMPPFRDPFNYNFNPLIPLDIEAVGTAMHQRLVERGLGGSEQRKGANYSTWWNGGQRTTAYFHNMIGLLTEIIGEPNPIQIPLVAAKQLPSSDWPLTVAPGVWHYSQSIAYEMQNNRAVLDYASKNREELLYDIYTMGRNEIQWGSEDSWTITPARINALNAAQAAEDAARGGGGRGARGGAAAGGRGGFGARGMDAKLYNTVLHSPESRDPRGYIIPSNQPDFATATKFVNALIKNGTEIEKATSDFSVNGQSFPAGSYVVMSAQADRAFVLDMFEPQFYPNDFQYPGGPPIPPYDTAGWTLADQMSVKFIRELDGFTGPFEKLPFGQLQPMPSYAVAGDAQPVGYLLDHAVNNAFIVTNQLLKAGADVYWLQTPQTVNGRTLATGTIYVPASAAATPILDNGAKTLGVAAYGVAQAPQGAAMKLKPIRIGLYDQYGGSMPSGWVRWMFDQYQFPYQVVYPKILDAGNLNSQFDVLVFVDNGLPGAGGRGGFGGGRGRQISPEIMATVPPNDQAMMGSITQAQTIPALKDFVQNGGTVLTIGAGTSIASAVGLPITSYLTQMGPRGLEPVPDTKFYIPGSLMRITIDDTAPLAYGMSVNDDVDFDHSPVFRIVPELGHHARSVAWYQGDNTLVSGWAWGQAYLNGGSAIVSGKIGKGTAYAIGPEVTFRAQPHGSFKFLFNGVYAGSAQETTLH